MAAESAPSRYFKETHYRYLRRDVDFNPLACRAERPTDREGGRFYDELVSFRDSTDSHLDYPASLRPGERKRVHAIAGDLGLEHESIGKGNERHIRISRRAAGSDGGASWVAESLMFTQGYVSLQGPAVNKVASELADAHSVPAEARTRRVQRDGHPYHITLLSKAETASCLDRIAAEPEFASAAVGAQVDALLARLTGLAGREPDGVPTPRAGCTMRDDWLAHGLGKASAPRSESDQAASDTAWFVVLDWPSGAEARAALGLDRHDFHITVGFHANDVHGVAKDLTTLLPTP